MKAIIKIIGTTISVLLIMSGLVALFTIDNAQGITGLIAYAAVMIINISGGIYLLTLMFPELLDLSEFEDKSLKALEDCQVELDILREHNILLLDRYITFKSIIKSSNVINDSNKDKFPNLYHLVYEEDLTSAVITVNEATLEQIDRFKEEYN